MNQEKIGKFIAEKRKEQKLTQEQLSEKLGVSKNAVSKWERGICLMDMSLLKPLSEILNVSINELLYGEKIDDKKISAIADENIILIDKLYNSTKAKKNILKIYIITLVFVFYFIFKLESIADLFGILSFIGAYQTIFIYYSFQVRKNIIYKLCYIIGMFSSIFLFLLFLILTI